MPFRPKRIFLADDDDRFRPQIKAALEAAGHQVVIEARNGQEARARIKDAKELGVEVAVLDCRMPNIEDGPEIAGALNQFIPELLVVSISDQWRGVWIDPNYDRGNPHPNSPFGQEDINGRQEDRDPDFYAKWVGFRVDEIAQKIGEMEFNIRDERSLEILESDWNVGKER